MSWVAGVVVGVEARRVLDRRAVRQLGVEADLASVHVQDRSRRIGPRRSARRAWRSTHSPSNETRNSVPTSPTPTPIGSTSTCSMGRPSASLIHSGVRSSAVRGDAHRSNHSVIRRGVSVNIGNSASRRGMRTCRCSRSIARTSASASPPRGRGRRRGAGARAARSPGASVRATRRLSIIVLSTGPISASVVVMRCSSKLGAQARGEVAEPGLRARVRQDAG